MRLFDLMSVAAAALTLLCTAKGAAAHGRGFDDRTFTPARSNQMSLMSSDQGSVLGSADSGSRTAAPRLMEIPIVIWVTQRNGAWHADNLQTQITQATQNFEQSYFVAWCRTVEPQWVFKRWRHLDGLSDGGGGLPAADVAAVPLPAGIVLLGTGLLGLGGLTRKNKQRNC